jgi:hypothetical protein
MIHFHWPANSEQSDEHAFAFFIILREPACNFSENPNRNPLDPPFLAQSLSYHPFRWLTLEPAIIHILKSMN